MILFWVSKTAGMMFRCSRAYPITLTAGFSPDMGFYEDIQKIVSHLPKNIQTLMFSATMPPKIRKLANETLNDPFEISIALSKPAAGVLQAAYLVYDKQKTPLVNSLIADKPNYKSILVFTSTKKKVYYIFSGL